MRLCRLDFMELCDADLGALDYRAIAQMYDIVTLENVMVMDLEGHNRARRFITLIDELYEAKCCLFLTVAMTNHHTNVGPEMTPMDLFVPVPWFDRRGQVSSRDVGVNEQDMTIEGLEELALVEELEEDPETVLGIDVATQGGTAVGALASVRELAFAFQRASSRIVEMCSQAWWEKQLAKKEQQQ